MCDMCYYVLERKETEAVAISCGICRACVRIYVYTYMTYMNMYVRYILLHAGAQRNRGRGHFKVAVQILFGLFCRKNK